MPTDLPEVPPVSLKRQYCSIQPVPPRQFPANVDPARADAILVVDKKWVNGTVLHYHFMETPEEIVGTEALKNVVRRAFDIWTAVGIGIKFQEIDSMAQAEVRIGFKQGDGSWSSVGRDVLNVPSNERTMNFGWDLTRALREIDTAVHEIGHTLGLPHEHQNPKSGIVWNEQAVFDSLGGDPNFWAHDKTQFNIIRKIAPDTVQGSNWDHDSIMHYPFEGGLIQEPAEFRNGLTPAGGLSERDKTWIRTFYPPLTGVHPRELKVVESQKLSVDPGEQADFLFKPTVSRVYKIGTFGSSDTVMVLFERPNTGDPIFLAGDDDSGEDRNALIETRLIAGRTYIVRIRLFAADIAGETAVMIS